jgi:hypothetical protein
MSATGPDANEEIGRCRLYDNEHYALSAIGDR